MSYVKFINIIYPIDNNDHASARHDLTVLNSSTQRLIDTSGTVPAATVSPRAQTGTQVHIKYFGSDIPK